MTDATVAHLMDVTYYSEGRGDATPLEQNRLKRNETLKSVSGFSSDSAQEACFLLAPGDQIEESNKCVCVIDTTSLSIVVIVFLWHK